MVDGFSHLEKWLTSESAFQKEIKDGDPQISALYQFLSSCNINREMVIVDFGSGAGILPGILSHIISKHDLPFYYGVDFEDMLNSLILPDEFDGKAKKVTVENFYSSILKEIGKSISIIVIRNVLHEMDIVETSNLFSLLSKYISKRCKIYIQDLTNLSNFERGHVGWSVDQFAKFATLSGYALSADPFEQKSYSGNRWFSCTLKKSTNQELDMILRACAECRGFQRQQLMDYLSISPNLDSISVLKINHDIATILYQENAYYYYMKESNTIVGGSSEIFLFQNEHAFEVAKNRFGLVYILENKRILDLAKTISFANARIYMFGFSNRSVFGNDQIVEALTMASLRGACIRILISNPLSTVVELRASEPSYGNPLSLLGDINDVIAKHQYLFANKGLKVSLRLYSLIPYNSYLIIDNRCFLSLNTSLTTGSVAPCFVFKEMKNASSYFELLLRNFDIAWQNSAPVNPYA